MTTTYTDVAAVSSKLTNEAKKDLETIKLYRDAVNFLAASMIYLKDNYLVRDPLKAEHVKERLLGHWGTCPGINIAYAHTNYLIKKHEDADMLFVLGPGHGAPAIIANLYVSGELAHFYPQYGLDYQGVSNLIRGFSYPGGFPSHTNPYLPGTIHEGGELGYSLAVSYGAVMNKPNLIVTCLVGDGEAETGPTATAWHAHKFIDPKESGAVLPIVHINGYKISSATLYGTMDDENLVELFTGYGYQPRIVKNLDNIDVDMSEAMEWAYQQIRAIQKAAREGKPITKPRWPVILMITPKGWTGIKTLDGKKIEGNCLSHQVPAKDARTNPNSLKALEDWLKSYNVDNFFDEQGNLKKVIIDFCNFGKRGMGLNKNAFPEFTPLDLPSIKEFAVPVAEKERCCALKSATFECGKYLAEVIKRNPQTFKIFSPDELESNKFDYVFKVTGRNYQWLEATANKGGSVVEILSEHTCQGFLQGYLLTGRFGLFPSYEAFLGVVATMMVQYAKFLKIAAEVPFRGPVPSMNYVETSTLWRQEHNGFSHQNPGFINTLVNMKASQVRIYLPPDANCMISTMDHVLKSKNYINLIISSKLDTPSFLSMEEAIDHCRAGASVWKFASTDNGVNPDVVLVAIGAEMTTEVIAASYLLKQYAPSLRIRVVNVTDMMILEPSSSHPHGLTEPLFNGLFTEDKPVIVNFHGYPSAVKQLLFGRKNLDRFTILGYIEEGTTTTPFKMLTSNKVSRYDVAIRALQVATAADSNSKTALDAHTIISKFQHFLRVHDQYILKHGADPAEVENLNLFISNLKEKPISESQLP